MTRSINIKSAAPRNADLHGQSDRPREDYTSCFSAQAAGVGTSKGIDSIMESP